MIGQVSCFLGISIANALFASAMTAEKLNSTPTPNFCQTQPPASAARMLIRWLIEIPVVRVAVTSSAESEMSRTYMLVAMVWC